MGHADSVTNDEHGSQSDISDWSSSNPITQVIETIRTTQENIERQVRSKGTPHVGHANSVTNDERGSRSDISDRSSSNPITQVINQTPLLLYMNIHSSMHAFIHSIHPKALVMHLNASQRSVLHHVVAVASFNMSDDRPGFEGQPMKGSRPPHVK